MSTPDSDVVSSGMESTVPEAASPSTESTQTESPEATTDTPPPAQTPQEKRDYRRLQKEDADLNAHVQREIAKALQKRERQMLKSTAKAAVDNGDAETALSLAQRIASEPDEQDEDEVHNAAWQRKADQVKPHLDRLLRVDSEGRATNPYYVKVYQKLGQATLDQKYSSDPGGFVDWLEDQMTELRVDDMLRKKAPSLYEAGRTDGQNAALGQAPKPLAGGAGGSGRKWTADAVAKLTPSEYKAHRSEIMRDLYPD